MPDYAVVYVPRDPSWRPRSLDDVPDRLDEPLSERSNFNTLFEAVKSAIEFNSSSPDCWAIVVDKECESRFWAHGRICTPLEYKVAALWWPLGWEPEGPFDVPNCILPVERTPRGRSFEYEQAQRIVFALNQQCMNHGSPHWYAIVAIEYEPISRSVSFESSGLETTVEVRRLHIAIPEGGSAGHCNACPAHGLECNREMWQSFVASFRTVKPAR